MSKNIQYAEIVDGVVVAIIVAQEGYSVDGKLYIPDPNREARKGFKWNKKDGFEKIVDIPDPAAEAALLKEAKEKKNAEINRMRDEKRKTEGAPFSDDLFDVDEVSQTNITGFVVQATMMLSGIFPPGTFIYRSKTNANHAFTPQQIIELGQAIGVKVSEIYARSWELKSLIDAAQTIEEVEEISW